MIGLLCFFVIQNQVFFEKQMLQGPGFPGFPAEVEGVWHFVRHIQSPQQRVTSFLSSVALTI